MAKSNPKPVSKVSVFVRSVKNTYTGALVLEASNGGYDGPPFVRFNVPASKAQECYIGKRYILTIEEMTND